MAFDAAIADRLLSRRRMGWCGTIAFALASVTVSLGAAAWITDSDMSTLASVALPENTVRISSFEERFLPTSMLASPADSAARSALAAVGVEMKVRASARRAMSADSHAGFVDNEAKVDDAEQTAAAVVPLPRSRPPAADLESRPGPSLAQDNTVRRDDRTLLQKLSDLLPGRVTLASLT